MKKNWKPVLFTILGLSLFIWLYISIADFNPPNKEDEILKRINELELKIDSIKLKKDSIRTVIDSTHIKIITNEKHYKEKVNTIMLQPFSADSSFIIDYIRQYRGKNDSINIPWTFKTKGRKSFT